jgi:hypothetical protein
VFVIIEWSTIHSLSSKCPTWVRPQYWFDTFHHFSLTRCQFLKCFRRKNWIWKWRFGQKMCTDLPKFDRNIRLQKSSIFSQKMMKTRGPFLTSPLGANFDPRDELCPRWSYPLGVKFSILLNSRECLTLGVNEGVKIPPRGQILPLRFKFTPMGEVKNGPLQTTP